VLARNADGTFIGIDLLFKGWSCLMFALASRTA
jgi:uncharacterized membrane protein HdeD (DUF308 family)